MADLDKDTIIRSTTSFKERSNAVLHDDVDDLEHNLKRLVKLCENDPLIQSILRPVFETHVINSEQWWNNLTNGPWYRQGSSSWEFPDDADEEFALRYCLLKDISSRELPFLGLYLDMGASNVADAKKTFVSVIARPFLNELTNRISGAANIPSSEYRALRAVPPERIPGEKETRIFLSHKTIDKQRVMRYYNALKELGYNPWLDEPEMPAGTNPDRSIKKGFQESCAAVFFVTENFVDERFLADEINNAKAEERKKGNKFKIIVLLFSDDVVVPELFETYTYKHVRNDLDGLYEIIRALPIELGAVQWKESAIAK
jgi:hypothetical protein